MSASEKRPTRQEWLSAYLDRWLCQPPQLTLHHESMAREIILKLDELAAPDPETCPHEGCEPGEYCEVCGGYAPESAETQDASEPTIVQRIREAKARGGHLDEKALSVFLVRDAIDLVAYLDARPKRYVSGDQVYREHIPGYEAETQETKACPGCSSRPGWRYAIGCSACGDTGRIPTSGAAKGAK